MSKKVLSFKELYGIGKKTIDSMSYDDLYRLFDNKLSVDYDEIYEYTLNDDGFGISKESYTKLAAYVENRLNSICDVQTGVYEIEVEKILSYNELFLMVKDDVHILNMNKISNLIVDGCDLLEIKSLYDEEMKRYINGNNLKVIHNKKYDEYKRIINHTLSKIDTDGEIKDILNHKFIELELVFDVNYSQKDIDNITKPFTDCLFFYANASDNNIINLNVKTKKRRTKGKSETIKFKIRRLKHSEYINTDI